MTKTLPPNVNVTERALVQRLKRRFARDGQTFHVTRDRWFSDLGYWYATENNNVVWSCHSPDDLVEVAREMGALLPHEVCTFEA